MNFQIEYAVFSKPHVFGYKKSCKDDIEKNKEILIKSYRNYENKILTVSRNVINKKVFETKKCHYCGGAMRYITTYNFWGCENYKREGQHSTLNGDTPYSYKLDVSKGWLTEILYENKLNGIINAKSLYEFYLEIGFDDLREKYGYPSTYEHLNTLVEAKARSKEQELKIKEDLELMYRKVIYQQTITYKLQGENEKFCIPDFIVSNDKEVYVMDAKLDFVNDEKMDLYTSLVAFIMNKNSDMRKLIGAHVFYEENLNQYTSRSKYKIFTISNKVNHE